MSKDRHTNRGGHNKINLKGRRFGKLLVVKDTGRRKSRRPIWRCDCDCGASVEILGKYLLSQDTKSCGCIAKGNAHNRTGFKELSGSYWYVVTSQAKRRGIPLSITVEQAHNQLVKQNWCCALTGEEIKFAVNLRDSRLEQTASLDRIDNKKGYTLENIQWVHKTVNIMKNVLSQDDFINWCNKITSWQRKAEA